MQKLFFLIISTLLISTSLFAQRQNVEQQVESKRIAFISSAIDLKPDEAQKFWPVYNEYKAKVEDLRSKLKAERGMEKGDANSQLDNHFEIEQKQLDFKKEFSADIRQIIGSERTLKLMKAERKFKEKMLKGMRDKRNKRKTRN